MPVLYEHFSHLSDTIYSQTCLQCFSEPQPVLSLCTSGFVYRYLIKNSMEKAMIDKNLYKITDYIKDP